MKNSGVIYSAILVCITCWCGTFIQDTNAIRTHQVILDEDSLSIDSTALENILDIVLAVNGEGMPKPPTEFKKGHVSPTNANATSSETEDGFVVKLPSSNGVPTPTVHNGKLYVSGGFGSKQYFCFDAKSGQKEWGVDLDDDGPSSGVVEDGVVVFNTESCTIFACDENTGEQLWSYYLGDPLMSTPTVANGLVYTAFPAYGAFGSVQNFAEITKGKFNPSHVLIAMDLHTGAIKWEKWIDGDVIMAPVANEGKLHVVSFPGTYFVLDQQTGEFESAERLRGTSAPVFSKNGMIISRRSDVEGSRDVSESIMTYSSGRGWSEGYKRDQADYLDSEVQSQSELKAKSTGDDAGNGFSGGAPASSGANYAMMNVGQSYVSSLQSYIGSRALNFGGNNFNTMGDTLVCTDELNGDVRWKRSIFGDLKKTGGFLGTPPILVGSNILIATYSGDILIIDSKTGDQVRKISTGENIRTQPVAMDGWIYIGTSNGKVIGIDTGDATITGWPMLGKNAAHTNS
jgi:outer membrane protein assembly factor BamB